MDSKTTSTALVIGQDVLAEISQNVSMASKVVAIANDSDVRVATGHITGLKKLVKLVAETRKQSTEKLDALKKSAIALEREITGPIETEIARLDKLAKDYLLELDRQREAKRKAELAAAEAEAQRLAQKAERQAECDAALGLDDTPAPEGTTELVIPVVIPPEETKKPLVPGVKMRETWNFVIDEPHAVPREYCAPDETLIRNHIRAAKASGIEFENLTPIAGVRFTVDKNIVG